MLIAGGILYGIFLIFSGVGLIDKFLCFELFGELIVTWNAMSYLTAIKDYRGIMLSFLAAIAVTFLSGALLLFLGISHVEALMAAVCIGYGIMLLWDVVLLYEYFPQSDISAFLFLRWADEFLPLAFTGLCINIGLFAHLVIMWAGPLGKQVKGLFYGAPSHDVPALIAFLTILITTVNFVVSVEVNFYPKYRNYYSLFNDGGTIKDIMQAGTEMLDVLDQDYIVTARAKGLSQMKVLMRHAVRNSILPVVTILGPIVVNLMTGSLAVENIFSIPGIGSLFVDCIKANDYPVIMGITIFYAAFYMLIVLLVDLAYSLIDPRIRLAKGKES